MHEQNASDDSFRIMEKNRLKKWKRKREIPEYEEDVSNRLRRQKLDNTDDDDNDCIQEISCFPNLVSCSRIVHPEISDCSIESYFCKEEINERVNVKEKTEFLLSKPLSKFLEVCNSAQLPYQSFSMKKDKTNTHDKNCREYAEKAEICLSHSLCLENKVCMSEETNVAISSKKKKEYLDEVQSLKIYQNSQSSVSSFDCLTQNLNDMSPFTVKETAPNIIRPKVLGINNSFFCKKLNIIDESLRFTSWNAHHSYKISDPSDTFGSQESISFSVQGNAMTDCPKDNFHKYIGPGNEIKIEKENGNEVCLTTSEKDSNPASQIKNTIVDLFMLEMKIEQCNEVLKKFGIASDSFESFKRLKLKSAKLIKKYKILIRRRNKEKTRMAKSRKRARTRKNNVSVINMSDLNDEFLSALNIAEEDYRFAKEEEVQSNPSHKRLIKRKRKKEKEDEMQIPGRSKILDECIMRLNKSKIYSGENKKESECSEEKNSSQNYSSKESKNTEDSTKSELHFTEKNIPGHKQVSLDPFDEEIDKILLQLPPVGNIWEEPESPDQKCMNVSLEETSDYDTENSKSFVLYPYVTA